MSINLMAAAASLTYDLRALRPAPYEAEVRRTVIWSANLDALDDGAWTDKVTGMCRRQVRRRECQYS